MKEPSLPEDPQKMMPTCKCNVSTTFADIVFYLFVVAFIMMAVTRWDMAQELIDDWRSTSAKEQSVVEFAEGGEIKETRFPYSWMVKKPDGSIWWYDALGGEGASVINKQLLWSPKDPDEKNK